MWHLVICVSKCDLIDPAVFPRIGTEQEPGVMSRTVDSLFAEFASDPSVSVVCHLVAIFMHSHVECNVQMSNLGRLVLARLLRFVSSKPIWNCLMLLCEQTPLRSTTCVLLSAVTTGRNAMKYSNFDDYNNWLKNSTTVWKINFRWSLWTEFFAGMVGMIAVTSSALWHKVVLLKSTTKCFEIWAPKMERKGCWTSEKIQSQVGWGSGSHRLVKGHWPFQNPHYSEAFSRGSREIQNPCLVSYSFLQHMCVGRSLVEGPWTCDWLKAMMFTYAAILSSVAIHFSPTYCTFISYEFVTTFQGRSDRSIPSSWPGPSLTGVTELQAGFTQCCRFQTPCPPTDKNATVSFSDVWLHEETRVMW